MAFPFEREDRKVETEAALLLVRVPVRERRVVFDLTQPVRGAGGEHESFGKRGLAGAAMTYERDVANLLRRVVFHEGVTSLQWGDCAILWYRFSGGKGRRQLLTAAMLRDNLVRCGQRSL